MDPSNYPIFRPKEPSLLALNSSRNSSFNSRTYAPYVRVNQPNPNPTLNFTGQITPRQLCLYPYYSEPNTIQEMQTLDNKNIRRSLSMRDKQDFPIYSKDTFQTSTGYLYQDQSNGYQSYTLQPYAATNNPQKFNVFTPSHKITLWENESDKESQINRLDSRLDKGWFWFYKYLMILLYCLSIVKIIVDVFGIFISQFTVYFLLYATLNIWEAQQYWYGYISIKEKKLKMACEAVKMYKIYLVVGPLLYISAELQDSSHVSFLGLFSTIFVSTVLFYYFVLRKGFQVQEILKQREGLDQHLLFGV